MAKIDKRSSISASASAGPISKKGWKQIGIGSLVVTLGFVVLAFTDPQGQNFASHLSPFLILGGYAIIGFGILARDPSPQNKS